VAAPARAAIINVPCNVTDLVNAINTANGTAAADRLELASNCIYPLSAANNNPTGINGDNGLPQIVSSGGMLTIDGNGATIERSDAENTPNFRFFQVNQGADLTLVDLTLDNGDVRPVGDGGAILSFGDLALDRTQVIMNSASVGSGLALFDATTVIRDSVIDRNGNNGIYIDGGEVNIARSSISANLSDGVFMQGGAQVTIVNTTVYNNVGDGIDSDGAPSDIIQLVNSTVINNGDVGVELHDGSYSLSNNILANNVANDCRETSTGAVLFGGSNIIENNDNCADLSGTLIVDPQLTGQRVNAFGVRYYLPSLGSFALNNGNNNALPSGTTQDITNGPRILSSTVDIGAVEFSRALLADVNGDGRVTPADAVFVSNRVGTTSNTANLNTDSVVNQTDANIVLGTLGQSVP